MNYTTILSSIAATALLTHGLGAAETKWNNSFDLGATFTRGNSDTTLITLGFQTSKLSDTDEYFANLSYTFGESGNTTTNDEILAGAAWNHLLSDTLYSGVRLDFRRDDIADIDYRGSLTGLIGNYLVKNDSTYFALEAGIGYTWEKTGSLTDNYTNAYLGNRFEHKFDDKTRVYQTLGITAPLNDFDDFSLVAEVGLETFLSENMALKIYVQDKYEAEPVAGFDENDIRIITGISYKF